MSRGTFAIVLILCASWAAAEQAVTPPPHPLHKVGDHWTPYQPPTEFPPDANVYIIQQHDTLWDLSKKFLGNPYLWPQLWEKNKYITDAHWIYPGDPLVVGVKAAEVPAPGGETAPAQPTAVASPPPTTGETPPAQGEAGNLVAVGSEDDLYCFGYLDDKGETPTLTISSAEDIGQKENYVAGDIVFLSGGSEDGVKAGQEYFIVLPGSTIRHPATNAELGRVMRYLGHLRVLCTQDHSATAEIVASCDAIPLGSWLRPFEPMPIPMTVLTPQNTVCDQPNTKPKGYIVYSRDDAVSFGADHVVLIDLGNADQVAPGTVCTIYRDNPVAGMPRLVLGELAVLTTGEHWASAKIVRSSQYMAVGDRVEVK
ncbi:MAG: LysM peptidoglycan-binding domain-containing protein [Acidobacteriota bacterium]